MEDLMSIIKGRRSIRAFQDKDIPENLQLELAETLGEQKHKITVDEEFISMTFEIIGDIAQEFEKAYWDYKKEKFKIN